MERSLMDYENPKVCNHDHDQHQVGKQKDHLY